MALPGGKLDRWVQAFIGGAWVDVTPYVYERAPIVVTRGGTGERQLTNPSKLNLTFDNRDRRFSPRDPSGAYFRQIGRNTLIAAGVRLGECFLALGGAAANYITAPDTAGLSVTGDIDVRVDVTLQRWRKTTDLAGKYGAAGQRTWGLQVLSTGAVQWTWSADGTAIFQVSSTVPVPWPVTQRCTLRVTHDVNNGAAGSTVTFYYSTTPGTAGPWRQLGDPVVTAGITSLFDSTAAVCFGTVNAGSTNLTEGRVHAAEIRNGIGGSVVASPDVRAQARSTTSWSDGTNTWTVTGSGAQITNFRTEFVGEVPSWPLGRDLSGKDLYVEVDAAGIMRRLGQGQSPVQSTLRKAIGSIGASLRAYWPLEDGERAESAVSAVAGGAPMRFGSPAPAFGQSTVFDGSSPLPTLNGSAPRGIVRTYASTGAVQVKMVVAVPAGGAANGAVIMRISTGGTAARWDLIYGTGGTLNLQAYDSEGTGLGGSGAVGFAMDGRPVFVQVELLQNGANVDYDFSTVDPGKSVGGTFGGTIAGRTVSVCRAVQLNPGGLLTDTVVGHVAVESTITSIFAQGRPLAGWAQETAARRVERLCSENGITFVPFGDLDDSPAMGPQPVDTLLTILRECEATDGGTLFEPRDRLGLAFKPRSTLYSPGTRAVLAGGGGAGGDLTGIVPQDDDQLTRNDVTVTRKNGSSARATEDTGTLSVLAPPNGVGRYDEGVTVNCYSDSQVDDEASWRLNTGTIDEPRFPSVQVRLARAALTADPGTTTAILDGDLGDGLDVASPPAGLQPTTIRQLIVGYSRVLEFADHVTTWACQPAAGYDVAVFDYEHPDEASRYSSDGSTVNGAHTAGAATLSVATASGPLWAHDDGDYTIAIPETGERMRVTNVTGATSPQSFAVTRGVDGTTAKALTGGETVELARPVVWGV